MKSITKIVITGGPCAGKSTALSWIHKTFMQIGFTVLSIPESASELITGGVAPWTCKANIDFQKSLLKLQKVKEEIVESVAQGMKSDKILIVCDRGTLDNKAYMNEEEFAEVLRYLNTNITNLREDYNAVFHLVTPAKGIKEFYTLENNHARYETAEEAIALDDRIILSWTGHPHFWIIDNFTDFEDKMKCLIGKISAFLGVPNPFETAC